VSGQSRSTSVTFPTLGTTAFLAVRDPAELSRARRLAGVVLDDVDEVCSRFREDSDLMLVNAHPGVWVDVDPLLVAAVAMACEAARVTDGLVNPLLGRQLVELGYDRDFRLLVEHEDDQVTETRPPSVTGWQQIRLDPEGAIRIPAGSSLDLGATGKAWAADLIATALEEHLEEGAVVSVGGDLRIAAPDGQPWSIAVSEHPGATPDTVVTLDRGGLATSSTQVRRWTRAGVRRHHVLDPRTGLPARELWRTVTATGATCTAANTASTAAVVLGADAPQWLADHDVTARLVALDGTVHTVGPWPAADSRSAA
jgi:thiamine biosynthesis lipoprotein